MRFRIAIIFTVGAILVGVALLADRVVDRVQFSVPPASDPPKPLTVEWK